MPRLLLIGGARGKLGLVTAECGAVEVLDLNALRRYGV